MSHILALDQGTSSSRSIVFDAQGRIVAMAQRELTQHFPQPGWVEHDPMEIWATQLATAQEAIAKAGLTAADIRAIGITNQRETTLLWNRRTGKPSAVGQLVKHEVHAPHLVGLRGAYRTRTAARGRSARGLPRRSARELHRSRSAASHRTDRAHQSADGHSRLRRAELARGIQSASTYRRCLKIAGRQ